MCHSATMTQPDSLLSVTCLKAEEGCSEMLLKLPFTRLPSGSPHCAGAPVPEHPGGPMLGSQQFGKWESCSGEPKPRTQYLVLVLSKKYWIMGEPSLSCISCLCLYYCSDVYCCPWLLPALRPFLQSCCPGMPCLAFTAAWGSEFLGQGFSPCWTARGSPHLPAPYPTQVPLDGSSALQCFFPQFDVICRLGKCDFCHVSDKGSVTAFASVVLHLVTAVLVEYKILPSASKLIIQSVSIHPKLSA